MAIAAEILFGSDGGPETVVRDRDELGLAGGGQRRVGDRLELLQERRARLEPARLARATDSCAPAPMIPPPVEKYRLVVPSATATSVATAFS